MLEKIRAIPASVWIKTLVVLTGISLVPLIYAGALTWANEDPMDRLDQIPAAVVNLDVPATQPSAADDDATTLTLGDDLTQELLDSEENQNFDWTQMSADEAERALEEAEVYAVLTIPEDFSAAAASLGADDPQDALSTKLEVTTNDGTNAIAGNMANSVGRVVADTVRSQVSQEYLDNIYVGFTTIHDQVSEAADGATELSDGASDAEAGSVELVVGLNDLGSGATTLASGAADLATGASTAHEGAQQLASGSAALDEGAQTLSSGARELSGGLSTLADGVHDADDGARTLSSGVQDADDAAQQLSSGLAELNSSVSGLPDTLDAFVGEAQLFADTGSELVEGHRRIRDDVETVTSSSAQAAERIDAASSAAQQVKNQTSTLSSTADDVVAGLQNWDSLSEGERAAVIASAEQISSGLDTVDTGVGELLGTDTSGTGLAGAREATGQVVNSASTISSGVDEVSQGVESLSTGSTNLDELVDPVRQRLTTLTDAIAAADDGSTQLAAGTSQLRSGASVLAQGTSQLRDGADSADSASTRLAEGASELAANTSTLAQGAGDLADGVGQLDAGAQRLAEGSATLADSLGTAEGGAHDLASGLGQLSSGANELEDGLISGAEEIPAYGSTDADHLSGVAADPVSASMNRANEVPRLGYGMAAYFVPLALWIGGLSFYMMFPALRARAVYSRMRSWLIGPVSLLPGVIMGVVQALLVWAMLRAGLNIEPAQPWGLLGLMLLISLTFVAINQALVALVGSPGRFVGLILLVLQLAAAGATYPVQTAAPFFQAVHSWLPMTHAVNGVRSLIAGGGYGVGHAVVFLLLWFVGALAVSVIAGVLQRRRHDHGVEVEEGSESVGMSLIEESLVARRSVTRA